MKRGWVRRLSVLVRILLTVLLNARAQCCYLKLCPFVLWMVWNIKTTDNYSSWRSFLCCIQDGVTRENNNFLNPSAPVLYLQIVWQPDATCCWKTSLSWPVWQCSSILQRSWWVFMWYVNFRPRIEHESFQIPGSRQQLKSNGRSHCWISQARAITALSVGC